MSTASLGAVLALLPAMVGPLPAGASAGQLMLDLCGGGAIAVALQDDAGRPLTPVRTACCAKGCHTDPRKRLVDRRQ
ncbi:MAG: hypothetical protein ABIT10_10795 [Alteraurantiacibacter sp.]